MLSVTDILFMLRVSVCSSVWLKQHVGRFLSTKYRKTMQLAEYQNWRYLNNV